MTTRSPKDDFTSSSVQLGVLHTKFELLSSNLSEIKSFLKQVQDLTNSVKLLELQTAQNSKEYDKLQSTLYSLHKTLESINGEVESQIKELSKDLVSKIATNSSSIDSNDKWIKERYNIGKGIFIAMNALLTIIITFTAIYVKLNADKLDRVYTMYSQILKDKR